MRLYRSLAVATCFITGSGDVI